MITGRREKELKEAAAFIKRNVATVVGDILHSWEDLDRLYAVSERETWSHRHTLRERGLRVQSPRYAVTIEAHFNQTST